MDFTHTYMIMYRGLILLNHHLLLISIFTIKSDATSITHILRQLAAESRPLPNPQLPLQISPSPSPSPAAPSPDTPAYLPKTEQPVSKPKTEQPVTNPSTVPTVTKPNKEPVLTKPDKEPVLTKPNNEPVVAETCDKMSKKCHLNMLTACLDVEGSLLLVLNEADISFKVNVTVLPENITYTGIEIPRHQAKKINISDSSIRGSSSIVLDAGNDNCIIHMEAVVPKDNVKPQFPTLETYLTPINGAYVLFASVLFIGGMLSCFKSWKGRHTRVDGIPYQELEMGQSDLVPSANVENAEVWDQRWDDDWDEEKSVKSASANSGSRTGNDNIFRASLDGWRSDWDD